MPKFLSVVRISFCGLKLPLISFTALPASDFRDTSALVLFGILGINSKFCSKQLIEHAHALDFICVCAPCHPRASEL